MNAMTQLSPYRLPITVEAGGKDWNETQAGPDGSAFYSQRLCLPGSCFTAPYWGNPGLLEHLVKTTILVKLLLPCPVSFDVIYFSLLEKIHETYSLHWSQSLDKQVNTFFDNDFLIHVFNGFHLKSSLRQYCRGSPHHIFKLLFKQRFSSRSSQVTKSATTASANATCAASATPNPDSKS